MNQPTLTAHLREKKGKGAARRLRRNNQVPAIFYGSNREPVMLAVDYSDLRGILRQGAGENVILGLRIESEGEMDTRTVMLKELQTDFVKDTCVHADFYEISMDKELTINTPIHLVNTPVGVSNGGILQHVKRELTVSGLPKNLVDSLEVDVSRLDIGDSLHVEDIKLPKGVKSLDDDRLTVAVVAAPAVMPEEEVEAMEAEEEAAEEEAKETEAESATGE